jgi:hypothetical protein
VPGAGGADRRTTSGAVPSLIGRRSTPGISVRRVCLSGRTGAGAVVVAGAVAVVVAPLPAAVAEPPAPQPAASTPRPPIATAGKIHRNAL